MANSPLNYCFQGEVSETSNQASATDHLIGATVGNYRVRLKLGEGGMGSVYLAEHPLIGKQVALKVLHPELSVKEDVVNRFFNEARAVNDIQHPNIVDVIDFGSIREPGSRVRMVYFIMEFIDGRSLGELLRHEAPLPPERAINICVQMTDALAASHRQNIVHRDLKPDNVMLIKRRHENDFVKLLDFGIAKLTGAGAESSQTRTGVVMGTPWYMSPEQCEGRGNVDHRTDIYALGILLYQMLAGRVPFVGEGYGEVLVQHLTQAPVPPSSIRAGIAPHLEAICMKALAKKADDRFPSMDEFMRALLDPVGYVDAHGGLAGFLGATLTEDPNAAAPERPPMYTTPAPLLPTPSSPGSQGPWAVDSKPAQKRSWASLAIVSVIGLLIGGVLAASGQFSGSDTTEPTQSAELSPSVAPEPVAPPQKAAASAPTAGEIDDQGKPADSAKPAAVPAVKFFEITIASRPEGAEVYVDGEDSSRGRTPLTFALPESDEKMKMTLKKSGYKSKSRSFVLSENVDMDLTLKKDRSSDRKSRSSASSRKKNSKANKANKANKDTGKSGDGPKRKAGEGTLKPDFD